LNLEDLYDRTKPYILRRTLDDVFDLPPALDPVTLEVPLEPETWSIYKDMRDNAIMRLESGEVVTAAQAGVLVMRLAQITSGQVGGVEGHEEQVALGHEKLQAVMSWHEARIQEDRNFRVIYWCRFRLEAERLAEALGLRMPSGSVRLLYGGQTPEERSEAIALLGPGCIDRPAALVGIAKTGGLGLDLSGASTTFYVSNDYSLMTREQSAARVLGPNQKRPCAYYDLVATGPNGQKTVDHAVLKALREKDDLASFGAARWAAVLKEE
jgi:SNF2 family DNA or RNA helicase